MSVDSNSRECRECGGDLGDLAWRIQQLTEKLEYSQLQNSILTTECAQLRKALCEAEFMRGRTSNIGSNIPSLPTEVLQLVFFYATDIGGLAFQSWGNDPLTIWKLSSRTRCVIPLVCRRWHALGLKFLYQHIMIRGYSHIGAVRNHLGSLQTSVFLERVNWIRGLEFVVDSEDAVEVSAFASMARLMIFTIPKGQLTRVSIDCAQCNGSKTVYVESLFKDVLAQCHERLELLHVSCLGSKVLEDVTGVISSDEGNGQHVDESLRILPRMDTLSTLGGYRGSCYVVPRAPFSSEDLLTPAFQAVVRRCKLIRTLSFSCDKFDISIAPGFCSMLRAAVHLEEIHVVANSNTWMLHLGLELVLESTPRLKRLLITPVPDPMLRAYQTAPRNVVHARLAEIVLHMELWASYQRIPVVQPLFEKMKSGQLPALRQVITHGRYPEGCLDGDRMFPPEDIKSWRNIIDWCAELGVELVNNDGYPIHLWRIRHGIKVESSDQGSGVSEDEGDWYETEDSNMLYASESDSAVTPEADSDDGHYRYVFQPDLEQASSDSVEGD